MSLLASEETEARGKIQRDFTIAKNACPSLQGKVSSRRGCCRVTVKISTATGKEIYLERFYPEHRIGLSPAVRSERDVRRR